MSAWDDAMDQADIAEWELEYMLEEALRNNQWIANNGERIAISEMTDNHLLNSYFMIKRYDGLHTHEIYHNILLKEIKLRGLEIKNDNK